MILPIVLYPDPRLTTPCQRVTKFDASLRELAGNMIETMKDAKGIGLAANQVGDDRRIIIVNPDRRFNPLVMVNPLIEKRAGEMITEEEGCLSMPGLFLDVPRRSTILVAFRGLEGGRFKHWYQGMTARVIQHETSHLNGRTILDDKVSW